MLLFPAPSVITKPEKAEVWTQLEKPMQTVVQKVLENNYFHQSYKLLLCFWGVVGELQSGGRASDGSMGRSTLH